MSNEWSEFEKFQLEGSLQVLVAKGHTVGDPYFDERTKKTRCRVDGISLDEQTIFAKAFGAKEAEKMIRERSR